MRHTHTFAILPVSQRAYEEIAGLLRAAGYDHVFSREDDGEIMCMQGIALRAKPEPPRHLQTCGTAFRGCDPECPLQKHWEETDAEKGSETDE